MTQRTMARSSDFPLPQKLISGGQTGVDQAALDVAMELGLEHGGWCPRGRLCESGRIPERFQLRESHSSHYRVRTEQNVSDSDGTLIVFEARLHGGTALTLRLAQKYGRPCLLANLGQPPSPAVVRAWLKDHQIATLNVAGPRESSRPGIYQRAISWLQLVFRAESERVQS